MADEHRHHGSDVKEQGEALTPEAGRDIERPRGGPKGVVLAALLLLIIAAVAGFWWLS